MFFTDKDVQAVISAAVIAKGRGQNVEIKVEKTSPFTATVRVFVDGKQSYCAVNAHCTEERTGRYHRKGYESGRAFSV